MPRSRWFLLAGLLLGLVASHPSAAAGCGNGPAGFDRWLADFKRQAASRGISRRTLDQAFRGVRYNKTVIRLDRSQRSFKLGFKQFYARRVSKAMIGQGKKRIRRHARTLARIERRFGVPAPVLVSIWGLETGYGRNSGRMPVIRSLATLAYDCRRSAFFTNELLSALALIERGDMRPAQMRGAWAGELGQTQFLASSYVKYAVDFDGNGRRDLIRSVPDVLASTANFLRAHGWRRGGSWGPGSHNFAVLGQWNRASVYQKTIARMATAMAGR